MIIAGHRARLDADGDLAPWAPWLSVLDRELDFYRQCPAERGYPRFVCESFLDEHWVPYPDRSDIIPAMQNGMGILSYLKFAALRGARHGWLTSAACAMGDFLVDVAVTPADGAWPRFPRSTGRRAQFPLAADCGSQGDRPYEIEPDKGGIAAYALACLYEATGVQRYRDAALHAARVLAAHQADGDAAQSPWPFRVDWRTGAARGPVSGNMSFALRLYDRLIAAGCAEFTAPRQRLWDWIVRYQLPSARSGGELFAQFFEDHETPTNRSAWAPLNLARYLLEGREALAGSWFELAGELIGFVRGAFTHRECGVLVCHEQDEDPDAWGGINSTWGALLALFAAAGAGREPAREARLALNFTLYSVDAQGRPRDLHRHASPGGWQEDAHTDVLHNYADALRAFPAFSA